MRAWSDSEIAAELEDANLTLRMARDHVTALRSDVINERLRRFNIYGSRLVWPAHAEHAQATLERRLAEAIDRGRACLSYAMELKAEQNRRRATPHYLQDLPRPEHTFRIPL